MAAVIFAMQYLLLIVALVIDTLILRVLNHRAKHNVQFAKMQSAACMRVGASQNHCLTYRHTKRLVACVVCASSRTTRQGRTATPSTQLHAPAKQTVPQPKTIGNSEVSLAKQDQQQSLRWALPSTLVGGSQTTLLGLAALASAAGVLGSGFEVNGPASVLQALGALAAIIAVHEWGHFSAARLQNIHVTQFAIGFGPPLVSFKVRYQCCSSINSIETKGIHSIEVDHVNNRRNAASNLSHWAAATCPVQVCSLQPSQYQQHTVPPSTA